MADRKASRWIPCLVLLAVVLGCTTVPLTNRRQLSLIPDSQLLSMSVESYNQVLQESELSTNQQEVAMVRRVGADLAAAAERYLTTYGYPTDQYEWEFNVIKDDSQANAWAMPGGKVAVYTGIFPYTRNENGLAVVMGHEIAHALANHGNERMSEQLLYQMGGVALSIAVEEQPEETQNLFMMSYGAGTQLGLILPHSRKHEAEADRIGLTIMAMAGYDPREAIPFWQRMNAGGGARPLEFLSTHPAPESRIEHIREYLPEALVHYQSAQ
jgi:predicted Zn-dependent protease